MAEAKERKTAIYERIFELYDGALGKGFGVVPERKVGDARYPWLGGMDVFTQVYSVHTLVLCTCESPQRTPRMRGNTSEGALLGPCRYGGAPFFLFWFNHDAVVG